MLFLTENYAALDILKNPKNYLTDGPSIAQAQEESTDQLPSDIQPFILFGSSFPKDKEYTQVYDYIDLLLLLQIILCSQSYSCMTCTSSKL